MCYQKHTMNYINAVKNLTLYFWTERKKESVSKKDYFKDLLGKLYKSKKDLIIGANDIKKNIRIRLDQCILLQNNIK